MIEQIENSASMSPDGGQAPDGLAVTDRQARVRALNDRLRRCGTGGRVMLSAGVAAMPLPTRTEVLRLVATFEAFEAGNDPYGQRDFGSVEVGGERVFWKIDAYALDLAHASPDPADPTVTARVLTIMRAEEY